MLFLYNILIHIAWIILRIISLFNPKIKLFIKGRNESFHKLSSIQKNDKVIWFHAASLGEFEQGRPIIEKINKLYPAYKIVVTFFSPSGYEIRKNYPNADVICYLPFDTKANVKRFVRELNPEFAVIIKYEFWPNLLNELQKKATPTILVSGIFREEQLFFKWYGIWMQKYLKTFQHLFVQNTKSKELLNKINLNNVTVSGDTRFDRVHEILQQQNSVDFINEFKNNTYTLVAGSTWKEDEELLIHYINNHLLTDEKIIIAPHNIKTESIKHFQRTIKANSVLFSEKEDKNLADYNVFIVDTIGLLTKIYSYADVAYVGGGLATGLHNILEPATFGIPVVFGGHKYDKFQEAKDLIALGGATAIKTETEFCSIFASLKNDNNLRNKMGAVNEKYIQQNVGATETIISYLKNNL